MGLLPKPRATLTDAEVADALGRAAAIINPLLDLLSQTDPIGLRDRTHSLLSPPRRLSGRIRRFRLRRRRRQAGRGPSNADRARIAGAQLMNAADLPGTAAWERMSRDERIHWWVHRVGALNTLVVASPRVFGWLARVVPVGELAGFVNHAIVLCALAREYGVTDRSEQVRLLAAVLCDRQLPDDVEVPTPPEPEPPPERQGVIGTVWQLAGILRATFEEAAKRPQPKKLYQRLSVLPGLGAIAGYFGERDALFRAAQEGVAWLDEHTAA
ncbi:hypothetical protein MTER_37400 [Mycolicibacter terrae]|uniref:Uncharacterized protein n=1 Tax=Mycolicibacter terrae TaxID=1788 RepID=A0AAD1MJV1_9MYCO|nr:hypothetical protein [Mycolicibacter terrae]ORW93563.1 hypothetical protein AWC28_15880 [Mycolicibacter terrae]BBX24329.1 hypothetical protein MTER_37400 [Mycolicibacter terrae]SNV54308.1 Uncharacterised protein [Mycolicibacter terrae]